MEENMAKIQNQARAELVRNERSKRGWSQVQLAEIADLSIRTIQRLEKDGIAAFETLMALASAFNVTVEYLSPAPKKMENPKSQNKVYILPRITSGKELTNIVGGGDLFQQDYDQPDNKEQADMIAGFLQNLQDIGDIWTDIGPAGQVDFSFGLNEELKLLELAGYKVFGLRRKVLWGNAENKIKAEMCTIVIVSGSSPKIVKDEKLGIEVLPAVLA